MKVKLIILPLLTVLFKTTMPAEIASRTPPLPNPHRNAVNIYFFAAKQGAEYTRIRQEEVFPLYKRDALSAASLFVGGILTKFVLPKATYIPQFAKNNKIVLAGLSILPIGHLAYHYLYKRPTYSKTLNKLKENLIKLKNSPKSSTVVCSFRNDSPIPLTRYNSKELSVATRSIIDNVLDGNYNYTRSSSKYVNPYTRFSLKNHAKSAHSPSIKAYTPLINIHLDDLETSYNSYVKEDNKAEKAPQQEA